MKNLFNFSRIQLKVKVSKENMKSILFLISRYPGYGGIESVTTVLANQWIKQYRVTICSIIQQAEEKLMHQLDSNVAFYKMPYSGLKVSRENINFLKSIVAKENIDTVIFQDSYYPCQYLLPPLKDYKDLKIIEVEHSSPSGFEIQYNEYLKGLSYCNIYCRFKAWFYFQKSLRNEKRNRRLIYDVCDKYVMLAKGLIPQCQKYGHFEDDDKFEVIGNPISINNTNANLSLKKKECLFVGRLDSMKGIDRLVRIWANVECYIKDWVLVIVGDGVMMSELKNVINRYELRNVRIEGFQTDVEQYYQRASIFCMCSMYEGFPMVLPEAMSFGVVPIVFNSFAALDDILIDGKDGIKIKPFDEKSYGESLIGLILDDHKLKKMQNQALEDSQKFSIFSVLEKWKLLFENLKDHD